MTDKSRKLLMAVVGAYLVYLGVSLIHSVLNSDPKNATVFIICGAIFTILGAAVVFFNGRDFIRASKMEMEEVVEDEEEEEVDVLEGMQIIDFEESEEE